MEITSISKDRSLIIKIKGDIDHHTADDIKNRVENEYRRTRVKNIIFDFSEVSFMDSSGIGMIIGRYKSISEHGGKVYVCNTSKVIDTIFHISGLKKIIPCYSSVDEAAANI